MIFAGDLGAPEGPVALPDGAWLIVEAASERGCVSWLSADGRSKSVIRQTGRPNGLAVDAAGVIWVAESKVPSLLRTDHGRQMRSGCRWMRWRALLIS